MIDRRHFLQSATLAGLGAWSGLASRSRAQDASITLPFDNGERPLVKYPQKRPLIVQTSAPAAARDAVLGFQ